MSDAADPPRCILTLTITVDADTAQLSSVREQVCLGARDIGASEEMAEDFELAVSELATNVIRHTDACQFTVALARSAGDLVMDVSGADHLAELHVGLPADKTALSGRGLAIVSAVMDAVQLVLVDGHHHIRCSKTLG